MDKIKRDLIEKYSKNSKHSQYQILSNNLRKVVGGRGINTKTRFERERLDYILKKIRVTEKSILDIGGNTGFFTFELLEKGAKYVHYYDGNKEHADFVRLAAKVLHFEDKIKVTNKYISFNNKFKEMHDISILLNVLHHIGDDYGDKDITIEESKKTIINQLNSLKNNTTYLVFQLGFNWQGNKKKCLFEKGTKEEMIRFIKEGSQDNWEILNIGVAESTKVGIKYIDLNKRNIRRDDSLGEFLNRPLFILKSKKT